MAKVGRPKIVFDLELLRKLATIQCTYSEIAAMFDVNTETIERRMKDDPEFSAIYKKNFEQGKMSLRRKMYEMAQSGNVTMCIWLSKQYLDMKDRQEFSGSVNINSWDALEKEIATENKQEQGEKGV